MLAAGELPWDSCSACGGRRRFVGQRKSVGGDGSLAGAACGARCVASVEVLLQPRAMVRCPDEVKTLAATPNVLEVGLSDGTHGWLKVRAQVGAGGGGLRPRW